MIVTRVRARPSDVPDLRCWYGIPVILAVMLKHALRNCVNFL